MSKNTHIICRVKVVLLLSFKSTIMLIKTIPHMPIFIIENKLKKPMLDTPLPTFDKIILNSLAIMKSSDPGKRIKNMRKQKRYAYPFSWTRMTMIIRKANKYSSDIMIILIPRAQDKYFSL